MATQSQIDANRRNSQKSSGPVTDAGRAASRMNALKSGIHAKIEFIPGLEDPQQLQQLVDEYSTRFNPATPEERCLMDILIHAEWSLRRFRRAECGIMDVAINPNPIDPSNLLASFQEPPDTGLLLDRLQRHINATQRNYRQALAALLKLQAATRVEQPQPETTATHTSQSPDPQIGFVPSFPAPLVCATPVASAPRPRGPQIDPFLPPACRL